MNLDNLNLVELDAQLIELDAQEIQDVDGGIIPLIPFAVAYWAGGLSIGASFVTGMAYLGYTNNK